MSDFKKENYYLENHGDSLILWIYNAQDCDRLQKLPFIFKEIKKLDDFPAKYLIVKKIQPERNDHQIRVTQRNIKQLEARRRRFGAQRCLDLSKGVKNYE